MSTQSLPKNIALVTHSRIPDALSMAVEIEEYLNAHHVQVKQYTLKDQQLLQGIKNSAFDLLVALGGDGTMLRAGHLCASYNIPILGINLGRFGFLMEVQPHELQRILPLLLKGEYWLEKRMLIQAEHWRNEQMTQSWNVLNEIVICRGQLVRPIQISTYINGSFLTTYVADGLIVATPTGSTAYALAAGGPILPPELRNILVIPVAPHLSVDRAIIMAQNSSITMSVYSDHQAVFSLDGQPSIPLENGDKIIAHSSNANVQFIRFQDPGYFYRNLTAHMNQNPSTGINR